jgi:hypothetical protein
MEMNDASEHLGWLLTMGRVDGEGRKPRKAHALHACAKRVNHIHDSKVQTWSGRVLLINKGEIIAKLQV